MEGTIYGSLWNMLTTDEMVMLRTVARRLKVGDRLGCTGNTLCWLLKIEQIEKRLRNSIMYNFRRFGRGPLQEAMHTDDLGKGGYDLLPRYSDEFIGKPGRRSTCAPG